MPPLPLDLDSTLPLEPTLPLTPELKTAYQALYTKLQTAIDSTSDATTLITLNDSRADINDILTKDAMYRIHQSTQAFIDLQQSIKDTNADLLLLKARIAAITAEIATAAQIIAAVDKLLSLIPGL